MNTNHYFSIGKEHTICQDYALSGTRPPFDLAYAVVCDGCSASQDVDIGARLMALGTRETIISDFYTNNSDKFAENILFKASNLYLTYPTIDPQALDATVLATWVKGGVVNAFLYGDGVFVHKTIDGYRIHHINISSGAPDYISYALNAKRKAEYNNISDNIKTVSTNYNGVHIYKPFAPFIYTGVAFPGDIIAVISDGINSFRRADNTPISYESLIEEFLGFKTFEGEFVLRRLAAFKRKCAKEGITHSDDISIASIVI